MTRMLKSFLGLAALAAVARAAPTPLFGINLGPRGDESDSTPTPVSQADITSTIERPIKFARVAYCSAGTVTDWSCGAACDALPNVKVLLTGGDNRAIPDFFVASDPDSQTIVIAHQGTEANAQSIANDQDLALVAANTTRFPQAGDDVKLHEGFQNTQGRTADVVMATVQAGLASTGFKKVLVTGHSLGAAVASLDAAMLRMALPDDVQVDSVVFGLPRVGNSAWADFLDKLMPEFVHVTNQNDPVPNFPSRDLGFQQPAGELHITSVDLISGAATVVDCPGQENQNCASGNTLIVIPDHFGPYVNGISLGDQACPN